MSKLIARVKSFTFLMSSILLLSGGILNGQETAKPLTHKKHQFGETELEDTWFQEIKQTFDKLEYNGYTLKDQELLSYLQMIIKKVTPDEISEFDITPYVVLDPNFNAGMYPNGYMRINTGLLATIENEAELAFVLAHEIAHFVMRHSLNEAYNTEELKDKAGRRVRFREMVKIQKVRSEHSQENEFESDELGFEYYVNAGYDPNAALSILNKFPSAKDEVEIPKAMQKILGLIPSLKTHPKNEERIKEIDKKIKRNKSEGLVLNTDDYIEKQDLILQANLALYSLDEFPIHSLSTLEKYRNQAIELNNPTYQNEIEVMIGDMYQRMIANKKSLKANGYYSDLYCLENKIKLIASTNKKFIKFKEDKLQKLAVEGLSYIQQKQKENPQEMRHNRSLGLLLHAAGNVKDAEPYLMTYLESSSDLPDERYISSLLSSDESSEGSSGFLLGILPIRSAYLYKPTRNITMTSPGKNIDYYQEVYSQKLAEYVQDEIEKRNYSHSLIPLGDMNAKYRKAENDLFNRSNAAYASVLIQRSMEGKRTKDGDVKKKKKANKIGFSTDDQARAQLTNLLATEYQSQYLMYVYLECRHSEKYNEKKVLKSKKFKEPKAILRVCFLLINAANGDYIEASELNSPEMVFKEKALRNHIKKSFDELEKRLKKESRLDIRKQKGLNGE